MNLIKDYKFLGIIVSILVLGICFFYKENTILIRKNDTLKLEKQVIMDNTKSYSYLNSITVNSFENKIKNKKNLFVYIENAKCSDCSFFSKILEKEVVNFSIKDSLYLVDISELHKEKYRWLAFKKKYKFNQTPSFLLFQKGEIKGMIQWDEKKGLSEVDFHHWLEENKTFIKSLSME